MAIKIKVFGGALAAVQLAMSVAHAQTPPAPSAERLRLARAVFEAQGGVANVSASMDRMMDSLYASMPSVSDNANSARANARRIMQKVLPKYIPQILDAGVEVYAETFDEHQLADILAFYQSPTGQAFRDKLPEISARTGAIVGKLIPAMMVDVLDQVCDQSTCTAEQQKTLLALKARLAAEPAP